MVFACANFTRPPELPSRKAATARERPLRNCDRSDLESEDQQTREEELGGGGGLERVLTRSRLALRVPRSRNAKGSFGSFEPS